MAAGSTAWVASSTAASAKRRPESTGASTPVSVATTTWRPVEHVPLGPVLEPAGLGEQLPGAPLGVARLAEAPRSPLLPPLARLAPERERLLDEPRGDARRLVPLHPGLERPVEQCRHHPRRVADAHAVHPGRDQPLEQVVGGQVRGRRGEHLLPARHGAPDHLDEHGGLAGSGRPVDERHVEGPVGEVERRLLLRRQARREAPARVAGEGSAAPPRARTACQRFPSADATRRSPAESRSQVTGEGTSSSETRPEVAQSGGGSSKATATRSRLRRATTPEGASSRFSRRSSTRTSAPTPMRDAPSGRPGPSVGDERPAGQDRLVERLHVGEREPARLPLGERRAGTAASASRAFSSSRSAARRAGEAGQVVGEHYQAMAIPPGRGQEVAGLRRALPARPVEEVGHRPADRGFPPPRRPGCRTGSACPRPCAGRR